MHFVSYILWKAADNTDCWIWMSEVEFMFVAELGSWQGHGRERGFKYRWNSLLVIQIWLTILKEPRNISTKVDSKDVPLLEEVVIVENAGHFVHEEKPHEINTHIHDFIKKFWTLFPLLNVVTFFWVLELFILSSVLNFSFIYLFVINFRSYFSISRK